MSSETTITEETDSLNSPLPGDESEKVSYNIEFRGNAIEYFKIWIVNTGLSIITLGIYSAWAKVRTNRYIYGSTFLDSSSFQYTASPLGILKGRLIAGAFFAVYMLFTRFFPEIAPLFFLLAMPFIPWMVVKSLRFRSRYSRYRNISLDFTGTVTEARKYWFWMYFLVIVTFGFIIPYIDFRQKEFMFNRNNYGQTPFNFSGKWENFFVIYILGGLITFGLVIAALLLGGGIIAAAVAAIAVMTPDAMGTLLEDEAILAALIPIAMMFLYLPAVMFMTAYKRTSVFNYLFNNTTLGSISFTSTQKILTVFWIYLSNFFAIVFTLGILYPWALMRLVRYRMENISLETDGDLDSFLASENQNVSATGEEIGEAFDFDISI